MTHDAPSPAPAGPAGEPVSAPEAGFDRLWDGLERFAVRRRDELRAVLPLFVIAVICRLPAIMSFTLTIDDEFTALRTDPTAWVGQGRWGNWLLERIFLDQPCVPVFPELLFCAAATVSYLLLLHAHRIAVGPLAYAAFALFCSAPHWDLIGEFYGNVPGVAVGLVSVALAACLFRERSITGPTRERSGLHGWPSVVAQVALVALATGCYQLFLLMFPTVGLGLMLLERARHGSTAVAKSLRQLVGLAATTFGAAMAYMAVSAVVTAWASNPGHYIDQFMDPSRMLESPLRCLVDTLQAARRALWGSHRWYGITWWGASVVLLAGWGAILNSDGTWRPSVAKWTMTALGIACCLAPFAVQPLSPVAFPMRTMMALPYVFWLFAVLPFLLPTKIWRLVAVAGIAIATTQSLYLASTTAATRELVAVHDRQFAAEIYARLEAEHPDFDLNRTYKVFFAGAKPCASLPYTVPPESTARGSFFTWDGGNHGRIVSYMRLIGYSNLAMVPPSREAKLLEIAATMPPWPAAGSVKVVKDVTVFRLGPLPPRR